MELTQEYVLSLFSYRDGNFFWKDARPNVKAGDLAGYLRKRCYRDIRINGKLYLAHRLIFLYHHGYLPEFLDHIDGDPSNNNISNLREATNQENQMNRKKGKYFKGKPTSSEFKGVSWDKSREKWISYIKVDDKQKYLGRFDSEIDAACAYDNAAIELFGEFAKSNECQPL